jgi:hypothetical protein
MLTREQILELAGQYVQQQPFDQNMGCENKALLAGKADHVIAATSKYATVR